MIQNETNPNNHQLEKFYRMKMQNICDDVTWMIFEEVN